MFPTEMPERGGRFTLLPMDDVYYGPGSIAHLGPVLEALGVRRALLVTGRTIAGSTDYVGRVAAAAGGRIAAVFSESVQHVHSAAVLRAAAAARAVQADGIVSLGGGSPNDTGKGAVLALAEDIGDAAGFARMRARFTSPSTVEIPSIGGPCLPMVALPTTLSGGEATNFVGITDEERKVKDLYIDRKLTARALILDPELTLATPAWLWHSTGMRAVDHCIEAISSRDAHPFTDALAAHALGTLALCLRRTIRDPGDLAARVNAQIATWMSVCGLANVSLGLSHGIGHQLGARCNVPHGITSCVMMPAVMAWNRDHVGDKHRWIAALLGAETAGLAPVAAGQAGRDAVLALIRDLGQPWRLRDVGVTEADFDRLATDALGDMIVATNPRPVTSKDDIIEVLRRAY
ncbi:iron-containing alcohol dehydrogenase [Zavarzinia compransoris]|uniref:Maleylacetate reductase n=1 Tax=Zavarzinia compransoris TaxID=1264899 RepID=A0A317E959_9PROT|nr:iron-containing alcohol dehydrogenase [Zavarzinia compransoris]PWR21645.1 maleylacetate reductase [Zavarzinia compransoris]TDP45574.1 alcohol dehydrogenase class IV [Zavarzinia compransoris]